MVKIIKIEQILSQRIPNPNKVHHFYVLEVYLQMKNFTGFREGVSNVLGSNILKELVIALK